MNSGTRKRPLCLEQSRVVGKPVGDGGWFVVHYVVDAWLAAVNEHGCRGCRVTNVNERKLALAFANNGHAPPADVIGETSVPGIGGSGTVKGTISQHDTLDVGRAKNGMLVNMDGFDQLGSARDQAKQTLVLPRRRPAVRVVEKEPLCAMTRRTLAARAPSIRINVPSVRRRFVTANSSTTLRGLIRLGILVSWWMSTSGRASTSVRLSFSRSKTSQITG